jgi:O-antigen/teichoic acid export membrane protein
MLQVHDFGDYRVARAFAIFFGALVLLGGDRAAPRMFAEPLDRSEFSLVWEYLRFYGLLGVLVSAVVIGIVWVSGYFYSHEWDPHVHHAITIMALSIPFQAAGALAGRTLQSAGRTFLAAMPWRVGAPVLFIAALVAVNFSVGHVDLKAALWLAVLIIVGVTAAQWAMVLRYALRVVAFDSSQRAPRAWLGVSVPMMGVFLVTIGLSESDLYFLEWLAPERSVGHYAAAITTAHFVPMIQTAIVALYAPLIARELRSGTVQDNKALASGQRIMLLALAPVVVGFVLIAEPVMGIFGESYKDAAPALRLLALGNGAWALAALSALWLQYQKRGLTVVRVTVLTLIVDSILNLLLIPKYGMIGAAGSSAATSIGATIAMFWFASKPVQVDE